MYDEATSSVRTGDIEGVKDLDSDTLTFETSINGISATTFGYLDATSSIQTQLTNLDTNKANLTGATFTGDVIAPTQISSDNSTKVATTAFVKTEIGNLVGGASTTLDTLSEIATALGNDANLSTTLTNSIGTKVATSIYDTEKAVQNTNIANNASAIFTNAENIAIKANNY